MSSYWLVPAGAWWAAQLASTPEVMELRCVGVVTAGTAVHEVTRTLQGLSRVTVPSPLAVKEVHQQSNHVLYVHTRPLSRVETAEDSALYREVRRLRGVQHKAQYKMEEVMRRWKDLRARLVAQGVSAQDIERQEAKARATAREVEAKVGRDYAAYKAEAGQATLQVETLEDPHGPWTISAYGDATNAAATCPTPAARVHIQQTRAGDQLASCRTLMVTRVHYGDPAALITSADNGIKRAFTHYKLGNVYVVSVGVDNVPVLVECIDVLLTRQYASGDAATSTLDTVLLDARVLVHTRSDVPRGVEALRELQRCLGPHVRQWHKGHV